MAIKKQTILNISLVVGAVILTLLACNWLLHKFIQPGGPRSTAEKLIQSKLFDNYTAEELDFSLPLYTKEQGQECIVANRKPKTLQYSPYFGWNTQKLDKSCAMAHFSNPGTKIIYFGGSALENFEAPNHLTKIDNYVSNRLPGILSLNLAESGGRSTNSMVRLIVEAIDLPADYWVFLDGYNEFNSIKYDGNYNDDFYWTASVHDRIHRPIKFLFDKLISKSRITELLFYSTGIIKNPRVRKTPVSEKEIYAAADYYVENFKKINLLCEAKHMRCLFFLQPYRIAHYTESTRILDLGYARILEQLAGKVIDLRPGFVEHQDAFVDEVHFNKEGSELVATAIVKEILSKRQ